MKKGSYPAIVHWKIGQVMQISHWKVDNLWYNHHGKQGKEAFRWLQERSKRNCSTSMMLTKKGTADYWRTSGWQNLYHLRIWQAIWVFCWNQLLWKQSCTVAVWECAEQQRLPAAPVPVANALLIPGKTLAFLDEVQECKEIVTAIKFLVEEGGY